MNKVYIAGPMSGVPQFNFPAFFAAADFYRSLGWEVFNPADVDVKKHGKEMFVSNMTGDITKTEEQGFDLGETLAKDLSWICREATHIYFLQGWEKSRGATAEHATAIAMGLTIMYENG